MKPQLHNEILVSFFQWFDNKLLNDGQAFVNYTGTLYPQKDPSIDSSIYKYAAPHKQWVCDSSVENAIIPSGIFIDGSFSGFNPDLLPDWNNGRVLSRYPLSGNLQVGYSTKEFNLYLANRNEEEIIFQSRYQINPYYTLPQSGIAPYVHAWPACYVNYKSMDNEPWSIGSADFQKEKFNVRVVAITNDTMNLDGLFSLFMSQKHKVFKKIGVSDDPLNEYGSFKIKQSGSYNYDDLAETKTDLIEVSKVNTSKLFSASHEMFQQSMQV
jgi:hypothetical protein